jgi:hypothetical protein
MDKPVMIERPILFSGPMVRAILAGAKTQTRRVVKPQYASCSVTWGCKAGSGFGFFFGGHDDLVKCPYGQPGDRLWVRETGWERPIRTARDLREGADTWEKYYYDADGLSEGDHEQFKAWGFKRRPSIYMPRWASRITLEVTGVRVERLQDIGEQDAKAEGVNTKSRGDGTILPSYLFQSLWDSINAKRAPWASNPWVWVISFERCP